MGNIKDGDKPRSKKERQEYEENLYLAKIKALPELSEAEELVLLTAWKKHKDLKARNRVIEANLRLVLPIASSAVKRYRFMGAAFMNTYREFIAAGSLGLTAAADCFDPARGHKFRHYARRCIRNEVTRAAKRLLSTVDRPYYMRTPMDMMLDPAMPDPVSPADYCGSRARVTTGSDRQDEPIRSVHGRLRPKTDGFKVMFEQEEDLCALIYDLRRAGLTLKETAAMVGKSVTTVWRYQQAHREALHG
jgi:RNA polymerase sigma factor (sigma-70 family)